MWHSFTSRLCSPSPAYTATFAICSRYGFTWRNASAGPDATMHAPPSATICGLPLTGAARKATPAASAAARACAEAAAETVEQSTITPGLLSPRSSPCSPVTTSARSRGPDTITNTMSQPHSPVIRSATRAPRAASGSVLALVRFHTVTRSPPSISRRASAAPIRPVPSQPRSVLMNMLLTIDSERAVVTPASIARRPRWRSP